MTMRLVVLESPFYGAGTYHEGDVEGNMTYAQECLLDCLKRGEAPIASHLLHTQVLNDENKEHRATGISAGRAWIRVADAVVAYIDKGISKGMQQALNVAAVWEVPIEMRRLHNSQEHVLGDSGK